MVRNTDQSVISCENRRSIAGVGAVPRRPNSVTEMPRQPKTSQSFGRGLSVLVALNESSPATLSQLVEATGLAKTTVMRILHTLRVGAYVELVDEGYRPLPRVRLLSSSLDRDSAPTRFVQGVLNDFAQVVKWPAEFLVRDGATMVIEVSNRSVAPIGLKRFVYTRFPLFHSAAGIALLAWMKRGEREAVIRATSVHLKSADRGAVERSIRAETRISRKRGYAMHDYQAPIEGTRAVSVPVLWREAPIAAVSLIVLRDAMPPAHFESFLLPRLREVANEIGQHYVALGASRRE